MSSFLPVVEGRWLDGYDFPDVLSRVRCPAWLLQADPSAGGALTDADAAAIVHAMAICHHVRFPGCAHQLHRDHPEKVLRVCAVFGNSRVYSIRTSPTA